jgi:sterol desaturase/sphingolipid hydroxylase (fatty acid hydroxylase superfamily)
VKRLEIEPFSTSDDLFQLAGAALNLAVTLPAVIFLAAHGGPLAAGWLLFLAGVAAGSFAADFLSGLLHWGFDSYFSERNSLIKRTVLIVREHHIFPDHIFRYSAWREAGTLSWFAALASAPIYGFALLAQRVQTSSRAALIVTGLTLSLEVTFMLEFHKAGHRPKRSSLVRRLQRMRLLLSPEHHLRHHSGPHDVNYCLINGIADDTLGRLGVFRAMEAAIEAATGAVARQHDRQLRREFARPSE